MGGSSLLVWLRGGSFPGLTLERDREFSMKAAEILGFAPIIGLSSCGYAAAAAFYDLSST